MYYLLAHVLFTSRPILRPRHDIPDYLDNLHEPWASLNAQRPVRRGGETLEGRQTNQKDTRLYAEKYRHSLRPGPTLREQNGLAAGRLAGRAPRGRPSC